MCYFRYVYVYGNYDFWCLFWDHSCSKQNLGQCSAETSPLRKQIIFVKWQLFQLICDLKLEQYGRVFGSHFGSLLKILSFSDPLLIKLSNFRWFWWNPTKWPIISMHFSCLIEPNSAYLGQFHPHDMLFWWIIYVE